MKRFLILCCLILVTWANDLHAQDTRFIYLSPIDGAGTDASPFRSRCLGMAGGGNIDLRNNAASSTGVMLCASDALPENMTGVLVLGNSLNTSISNPLKSLILASVGRTIVGATVEDAIREIVIPRLRRPRVGDYKIYLGKPTPSIQVAATFDSDVHYKGLAMALREHAIEPVLAAMLSVFETSKAWAASFADTFTGADGNLAGDLTWTEYSDTNWARVSNKAHAENNTSTNAEARASSTTDTDDQEVQGEFVWNVGGTTLFRCGVKTREENSTARTYYGFLVNVNTGSAIDNYLLIKRVSATPTTLATSAGATASPATIKGKSDASDNHTLFVGGSAVAGPVTDSSITSNTRGGINYGAANAADSCDIDNFTLADVVVSGRNRGVLWYQ
jgi:hypothetical protein